MDLVFPLQAVGHATKTTVEAVVVGEVGAKDIALATNKSLGYYVDGFWCCNLIKYIFERSTPEINLNVCLCRAYASICESIPETSRNREICFKIPDLLCILHYVNKVFRSVLAVFPDVVAAKIWSSCRYYIKLSDVGGSQLFEHTPPTLC